MADPGALSLQGAFDAVEEQLNRLLDQTLTPRGPDMLFDLVQALGLQPGAIALDAGCGAGRHATELAQRFGLNVIGVDPVLRQATATQGELAGQTPAKSDAGGEVFFCRGAIEALPLKDRSVDLVWCRDVLEQVADLEASYAELRRVLKPGAHAVVFQTFATDLLQPAEAAWLLPTMGCIASSMDPARTEAAIRAAGLLIERREVLGSEWGQYAQEQTGRGAEKLLHAARLIQDPDRYIRVFGRQNYEIALGDCLWHVYRLIGKLSDRVYLLTAPPLWPDA